MAIRKIEESGTALHLSKKFRGVKSRDRIAAQFARGLKTSEHPLPSTASDVRERLVPISQGDSRVINGKAYAQFGVVVDEGGFFDSAYIPLGKRSEEEMGKLRKIKRRIVKKR